MTVAYGKKRETRRQLAREVEKGGKRQPVAVFLEKKKRGTPEEKAVFARIKEKGKKKSGKPQTRRVRTLTWKSTGKDLSIREEKRKGAEKGKNAKNPRREGRFGGASRRKKGERHYLVEKDRWVLVTKGGQFDLATEKEGETGKGKREAVRGATGENERKDGRWFSQWGGF